MFDEDSLHSIELRECSFPGAYSSVSETQWGQPSWVIGDLAMCDNDDATAPSSYAAIRAIGHAVLDEIPDEGLEETIESMEGMRDFYTAPAPEVLRIETPKKIVQGHVTGRFTRPVFPVIEEG